MIIPGAPLKGGGYIGRYCIPPKGIIFGGSCPKGRGLNIGIDEPNDCSTRRAGGGPAGIGGRSLFSSSSSSLPRLSSGFCGGGPGGRSGSSSDDDSRVGGLEGRGISSSDISFPSFLKTRNKVNYGDIYTLAFVFSRRRTIFA